ncbi:hypothetical protein HanRHA438_Chr08g0361301 [Helianthus annuus]|nr:hypothetical protein HanRHA438_Chr08g0361301 [Helianthus annuus]
MFIIQFALCFGDTVQQIIHYRSMSESDRFIYKPIQEFYKPISDRWRFHQCASEGDASTLFHNDREFGDQR